MTPLAWSSSGFARALLAMTVARPERP